MYVRVHDAITQNIKSIFRATATIFLRFNLKPNRTTILKTFQRNGRSFRERNSRLCPLEKTRVQCYESVTFVSESDAPQKGQNTKFPSGIDFPHLEHFGFLTNDAPQKGQDTKLPSGIGFLQLGHLTANCNSKSCLSNCPFL